MPAVTSCTRPPTANNDLREQQRVEAFDVEAPTRVAKTFAMELSPSFEGLYLPFAQLNVDTIQAIALNIRSGIS